jgi:hypothetical protein
MKGRTDKESSDRVQGEQSVPASWPGNASSRHDGKHGMAQWDPLAGSLFTTAQAIRLFRGLIGTARCGPACRVVWDPGLAVSVSLGTPIRLHPS